MSLPATVPAPHRTPLRRLSQGSLLRLSRSTAYPDVPHGLGFIEPALAELRDEVETLQGNLEGLRNLDDALGTFNESFASWLYVMNMNALTTDWPQAPTDASFQLAARRAEEDARAAAEALRRAQMPPPPPPPSAPDTSVMDKTTFTDAESDPNVTMATTVGTSAGGASKSISKKKGKPKLSNKEKKDRAMEVERMVSSLPLEFRGSDPALRRHIEMVIEGFFDREGRGVPIMEFVKPPDLNQARVNKCLIALVNRKIVRKDNSSGTVLYHWHGLPG
ncbi:DASH complex subunit Dam1-domain-containing protein [Cytidiella melzeri]|nr:DASH complex subunit Dam1-domain-containing protein [Cytidiella melzeri]